MRILHLLHQFLPERTGGTEVYTQNLARWQARAGHEVAVFAPTSEPPGKVAAVTEEGVRVYRVAVGKRGPGGVVLSTFGHGRLSEAFAGVVREARPDIVHVQHMMGLPAAIGEQLAAAGVPFVVTLWDFWWVCANAQLLTNDSQQICDGPDRWFVNCGRCALARVGMPLLSPALPLVGRPLAWRNRELGRVLAKAARLIAPAEFVGRWYGGHGAPVGKIVVVPPGLEYPGGTLGNSGELAIARPMAGTQEKRLTQGREGAKTQDGGSRGRGLRVGYVGGVSWQKGVHVVVEAVRGMAEVELWIAGDLTFDPAYVERLRELAGENVRFIGRLERPGVWEMLAQVDVLAVPSLWYETFVFVVSEAFAAGVPVVVSDLGVLAERVRHEVDGLLVTAGEVAAWRAAFGRLVAEPGLLERLRANIPIVLTMADHVSQIEQVYEVALGRSV